MIDLEDYSFEFHHISIPFIEYYYPISSKMDTNNGFSNKFREFKQEQYFAIQYFFNRLYDYLSYEIDAIVIVPSGNPKVEKSGLKSLSKKLVKYKKWSDYSCLIKQEHFIEKLSNGGVVRINNHPEKLTNRIRGEKILLLDDLITTGNSIYTCMKILEEAGVRYIEPFALAHAYHNG